MKFLPCLILLAMIVAACENASSPADPSVALRPAIYGTVKSADGTPLSGVRVALVFDVETGGPGDTSSTTVDVVPHPADQQINIHFENPSAAMVSVDIVRAHDSSVVANLIGAVLEAGSYTLAYRAHTLPNLVYKVRVKIGGKTMWRAFLLNRLDRDSVNALTSTGPDGAFVIEYSWLQLATPLNRIFENGTHAGSIRIGDSLSVVVEKPNASPVVWRFKIDTTVAVTRRFTM